MGQVPSSLDLPSNRELKKVLTWREGAGFTIAAVLGSGVLILPAVTANLAGPASLVSWMIMAVMIAPLAIVLGRLASEVPHAGGIAQYARQAFGPAWGRITGLLYLGTVPMGGPLAALIGAAYIGQLMGWSAHAVVLLSSVLLVMAVGFNVLGVEISGRTAVVVVMAISLILLAAVATAVPHVRLANFGPWLPHGWFPVGEGVALLFWAFVGWEMLAHMAEEFLDPKRDVMLAMTVAIVVIDLLYLSVQWVTVGTHMYGPGRTEDSLALLVGLGLGRAGQWAVAALAFLISYGTIHTYLAGFSRLVFAQARSGDLPAWFHQLHPRFRTPTRVLLTLWIPWVLVMGWAYAYGLNLAALIAWPSAIFIVLYILAMAAGFRLLPKVRDKVWAALGLLVSVGALMFLGWIALYPLAILAGGALWRRRQTV